MTTTTNHGGRLQRMLLVISPHLAFKYERWKRDRERARQRLERIRTAEPPTPPVEPEPRGDVHERFLRMTAHRRPDWCAYADSLDADKRALHQRLGHRGVTRAADNLSRWR